MISRNKLLGLGVLLAGWLVVAGPAAAQRQPPESDPLARMRAAAASNAEVCSVNEPSACVAAAPKIVAGAMGPSPLAENLRRLNESSRASGLQAAAQAAGWAVSAFRDAGADEVHTEELNAATPGLSGGIKQENVVAVIRGREKAEEFVVLGAALLSDYACNAALVIEAARDIHLTGLRPLRSIRFVLFGGEQQGMAGSRAYVLAHRAELDHAIGAVVFNQGCGRASGFSLGGRPEIEPGVRQAFAVAPVDSWGITHNTPDAPLQPGNFDFLLEGVPNLLANREDQLSGADEKAALSILQRNTAVAGVLAFALAEHPAPLGPRQSRAEIAALLKKTGLDTQMQNAGLWRDWESGQRGRQP